MSCTFESRACGGREKKSQQRCPNLWEDNQGAMAEAEAEAAGQAQQQPDANKGKGERVTTTHVPHDGSPPHPRPAVACVPQCQRLRRDCGGFVRNLKRVVERTTCGLPFSTNRRQPTNHLQRNATPIKT